MEDEIKINSIGDILGSTFKDGAEYSNTTKIAIFFSFWSDIVGKKYSNNTKPYSLKENKLYISCKNSFVLQEISLYKKDVIKKANIYSKAVDIAIDDIIFSYKNWNEINAENDIHEEESRTIDFEEFNYDDKNIKIMVDKIGFLNNEQKQKLSRNIRNNLIKEQMIKD